MKPREVNYSPRAVRASRNKQDVTYPLNTKAIPGSNTQKFFDQLPAPVEQKLDPSALRAGIAGWDREHAFSYPDSIPASSFQEGKISGVSASIYRSSRGNILTPTVVLVHGGAFFCELGNVHKSLMANIASRINCHGVLPHYSLAPEAKLPQAINEVTNVLHALLTRPEKYGVTNNLVVIGYSSGGNLVWNAVLAILNSPNTKKLVEKISQVILMSPWADLSMVTTKNSLYQYQQNSDKMLQTWGLEQMGKWTLPTDAVGTEPVYSPVYRPLAEMKGMPQTTIIAGEVERLLGDAVRAAQTLKNAGVSTQLVILEGQSHNHSAHSALRDGVFTPDIIAAKLRGEPVEELKGVDGLGVVTCVRTALDSW